MSKTTCNLKSKCDFLTGMYLTTQISDSDVDENALLTIQDDCPQFILPFNYKSINGETEFTYKVGELSKLQYFYGEVSHEEYVSLWTGILSPLLECADWFMNPCSFVLDVDYLYYDKVKKNVAYVYIPCKTGCSGYDAFNEMAVSVAKNIKVADPILENKVLRSIINDFNPGEFLNMLLDHIDQIEDEPAQIPQEQKGTVDILNLPVADAEDVPKPAGKKVKKPGGFRVFSSKSKRKVKRNGFKNTLPDSIPIQAAPKLADIINITQETRALSDNPGLRCVGRAGFPPIIEVEIAEGEVFTIGRHDVNVGKKRSDFEFEAKTKAVSRRHAAIEREGEEYRIVDLSSSAGTFINDKKLPPNTPTVLEPGCRVSFGNLGADYVWNVS